MLSMRVVELRCGKGQGGWEIVRDHLYEARRAHPGCHFAGRLRHAALPGIGDRKSVV